MVIVHWPQTLARHSFVDDGEPLRDSWEIARSVEIFPDIVVVPDADSELLNHRWLRYHQTLLPPLGVRFALLVGDALAYCDFVEGVSLRLAEGETRTIQDATRTGRPAAAYVLMEALRRLSLRGTALAEAQVHTIRLRLLKIGARIRFSARRVLVSMSSGYPWQQVLGQVWAALRC